MRPVDTLDGCRREGVVFGREGGTSEDAFLVDDVHGDGLDGTFLLVDEAGGAILLEAPPRALGVAEVLPGPLVKILPRVSCFPGEVVAVSLGEEEEVEIAGAAPLQGVVGAVGLGGVRVADLSLGGVRVADLSCVSLLSDGVASTECDEGCLVLELELPSTAPSS